MDIIKVSSRSVPKSVAGAITAVLREGKSAEVQSVGAGATNQPVNAIAIARVFLSESGIEAVCLPSFAELDVNGEEKTGMKFIVEKR